MLSYELGLPCSEHEEDRCHGKVLAFRPDSAKLELTFPQPAKTKVMIRFNVLALMLKTNAITI
jgi:hypothetical protein